MLKLRNRIANDNGAGSRSTTAKALLGRYGFSRAS